MLGMEFLMKSLGLDPETVQGHVDKASHLVQSTIAAFDARFDVLESQNRQIIGLLYDLSNSHNPPGDMTPENLIAAEKLKTAIINDPAYIAKYKSVQFPPLNGD